MKRKATVLMVGMMFMGAIYVDAEAPVGEIPEWVSFCDEYVAGNVVLNVTVNRETRNTCLTNVFHSLTTNGYSLVELYEPKTETEQQAGMALQLQIQVATYRANASNVLFDVTYVTSSDVVKGGQLALMRSTDLCFTMMPPWFYQYTEGPGNVCFVPRMTKVNEPTKIRTVFFCRDNVTVLVKNLHEGDILAFIQLLDACIIASPVD